MAEKSLYNTLETLESPVGRVAVYRLDRLEEAGLTRIDRLPYTIRILLENVLRNYDGFLVAEEDVKTVASWPSGAGEKIVAFKPSRLLLQDYTGVPAVVDLAAMRDKAVELGCPARVVDALIPTHLVIDHSVAVDYYGTSDAVEKNMALEFRRYRERYKFLKWAQQAFEKLKVIPPGKGIIHQVNIEYLAKVVDLVEDKDKGLRIAFPDTLIGADSHTTMVNGIGVLGWGAGGIEVEAVMLGQPYYMVLPEVVGVKLVGEPREGVTATDIALAITEFLRKKTSVVDKFLEFYGPGLKYLTGFDRTTIANMAPEYGSTTGFFPVDSETLSFLRVTGRSRDHVALVEWYTRLQHLYYTGEDHGEPVYTLKLEFDLSTVEPSIAGPANPEDRIPLARARQEFARILGEYLEDARRHGASIVAPVEAVLDSVKAVLDHGVVVLAAITSCTNTSNPYTILAAGLLAKKAVEKGLTVKPWVKTSFSPGSRVVVEYLKESGLMPYLEALRFHIVGYGCMTCIGNSGPLPEPVARAVRDSGVYTVAVLSGNRNFPGRIHPLARGNYLASPPLVVAYAIKGTLNWDPYSEPIGYTPNNEPVYLRDIWPSILEVKKLVEEHVKPEYYQEKYRDIFKGTPEWEKLEAPSSEVYPWDPGSTFIRKPPFFEDMELEPREPQDITGARVLLMLGDRVSTDHISPAGSIPVDSPAGRYLLEHGVRVEEFGSYGSRRGNHEVMVRGGFSSPELRNLLVERKGGYTVYWPTREILPVYEAARRYQEQGIPVIIIAGKQYGVGSSRDWAAKAPYLLGVRAVLAENFERIHRSNLVGMGILPLQFMPGENAKTLGLRGDEVYNITGIGEGLYPRKILRVEARRPDGSTVEFRVVARLDSPVELEYYRHGGILRYVLRSIIRKCRETLQGQA